MSVTDLLVVGGGPAGSAAAITAAAAGLSVALVEGEAFPRERPGESLHPGVEPLFRQLGVLEAVLARRFPRHEGHWVTWGSGAAAAFTAFGEDAAGPWQGFQARRGELDALLLARARSLGVRVLQPCRALRPVVRDGRVAGVETTAGLLGARFVVDATGGGGWLARQLGLPVERRSAPLVARYGYAAGACPARDAAPAVVADAEGWTWTARVGPGLYAWTRVSRGAWRPAEGWQPEELRGLPSWGRTRGADVSWRQALSPAGCGYWLAGDAAAVLDPAASHGVLKALMTGMLAGQRSAQVIREGVPEAVAAASYGNWLRRWFEHDVRRLEEFYAAYPQWQVALGGQGEVSECN